MKTYEPTYWNNKGKYQKEYDQLIKMLVPMRGDAVTKQGQLLRAITNFYYEKYNNGIGCNPIGEYTDYIRKYCNAHDLDVHIFLKVSEKKLDEAMDKVLKHIYNTPQEPLTESDIFYSS